MTDQLLSRVSLFAELPPDELARLATTLTVRVVPDAAVLFREDEYGEHFYMVVEGTIEVIKALGTPAERLLGQRGPGEFVGEMSLFNRDGRRTATVRARGPARLLEMTRADFDALLQRHPALAYSMVRVLSSRLSTSNNDRMRELVEKNRELEAAYAALKAAQAQIIENEKLERELQLAREIQIGMLPRSLPELPSYSFGARTQPARAVGGDLYDFIPLPDGRLGVVVADVAGKGMPAAIFAGTAKALLRAEAVRPGTPAEVLQRVNTHLLSMNEAGLFVTVLYGVLDPANGDIGCARAGHEFPLLAQAGRPSRACSAGTGQPLGLFEQPQVDALTIRLEAGDTLLLFSDGVTDAEDLTRDHLGGDRLRALLDAAAGWSVVSGAQPICDAQGMCDRLLQAALDFQGSAEQYDDMTLVAVQRVAQSPDPRGLKDP